MGSTAFPAVSAASVLIKVIQLRQRRGRKMLRVAAKESGDGDKNTLGYKAADLPDRVSLSPRRFLREVKFKAISTMKRLVGRRKAGPGSLSPAPPPLPPKQPRRVRVPGTKPWGTRV